MGGRIEIMKNWIEKLKKRIPAGLSEAQIDDLLKDHLVGKVRIGDFKTQNLITKVGRRAVISALSNPQKNYHGNIIPRFKILRFGASTSIETPTELDTSLGGSTYRRVVEQVDPVGDRLVVTNFIGTPEMNFVWRKVGLFLSDNTLFSIASVIESKTDTVLKTVVWEIEWE